MDYKKIYENLINNVRDLSRVKVKGGEKYENHHIIPKSIGGDNSSDNLILLTPKEHYICHRLLVEIYKDTPFRNKMWYAMWCMINGYGNQKRYSPSSRIYQSLRENFYTNVKPFNGRVCKKVNQYDLNGVYIRTFNSIAEASLVTGIRRESIESNCGKWSKSSGDYIWGYLINGNTENIEPLVREKSGRKNGGIPWNKGVKSLIGCNSQTKKVYQYDLKGFLIKEWGCIREASNELKINKGGIENCSLGKSKSSGGFIWRYIKEDRIDTPKPKKSGRKNGGVPWNKDKKTIIRCIKGNRKLQQYSLDGELIRTWDCVLVASFELGFDKSTLHRAASGKIKTYRGYQWGYVYKNIIKHIMN